WRSFRSNRWAQVPHSPQNINASPAHLVSLDNDKRRQQASRSLSALGDSIRDHLPPLAQRAAKELPDDVAHIYVLVAEAELRDGFRVVVRSLGHGPKVPGAIELDHAHQGAARVGAVVDLTPVTVARAQCHGVAARVVRSLRDEIGQWRRPWRRVSWRGPQYFGPRLCQGPELRV